jgi:hypothetical protein
MSPEVGVIEIGERHGYKQPRCLMSQSKRISVCCNKSNAVSRSARYSGNLALMFIDE